MKPLVLLTLAITSAHAATPVSDITVPPGFKVELLREATDREGSWISMALDNEGRIYISPQGSIPESGMAKDSKWGGLWRVTVRDRADQPNQANQPDTLTKMEKVPVPIGDSMGMLWAFDSLYVSGNGPEGRGIYRCKDTDGDSLPDTAVMWKRIPGGAGEHGAHALVLSPDKQHIYIVHGNATGLIDGIAPDSPYRNWGEDDLLPNLKDPTATFFDNIKAPYGYVVRTDEAGEKWELIAGGFRNPYDIAFNADGELFTYDSDMEWDRGLPWYRPTRVLHIVPGGEYGFREGSAKMPAYYPDTLPAVVDVGLGCPTGVKFGTTAKGWPEKYRTAFFACDWTYGRILAVHMKEKGASYTATNPLASYTFPKDAESSADVEPFVVGKGMPVTDVEFLKDGSMVFTTGGRGTSAGLYRVSYGQDGHAGRDGLPYGENPRPSSPEGPEGPSIEDGLRTWERERGPIRVDSGPASLPGTWVPRPEEKTKLSIGAPDRPPEFERMTGTAIPMPRPLEDFHYEPAVNRNGISQARVGNPWNDSKNQPTATEESAVKPAQVGGPVPASLPEKAPDGVPWNRPEKWEGQGPFAGLIPAERREISLEESAIAQIEAMITENKARDEMVASEIKDPKQLKMFRDYIAEEKRAIVAAERRLGTPEEVSALREKFGIARPPHGKSSESSLTMKLAYTPSRSDLGKAYRAIVWKRPDFVAFVEKLSAFSDVQETMLNDSLRYMDDRCLAASWMNSMGTTVPVERFPSIIAEAEEDASSYNKNHFFNARYFLMSFIGITKNGPPSFQDAILKALTKFPLKSDWMPDDLKLLKLRILQLTFARHGRPSDEWQKIGLEKLLASYPAQGERAADLNRELSQLLVWLSQPELGDDTPKEATGKLPHPTGEPKAPAGASGGAVQPSGGAVQPSGGAVQPSGGVVQPSGGAVQPSGGAIQPSGGAIQPSGGAIQPSGGAVQPSGGAIQPSGGAVQPSGGAVQPSGGAVQPSGEGKKSSDAPEKSKDLRGTLLISKDLQREPGKPVPNPGAVEHKGRKGQLFHAELGQQVIEKTLALMDAAPTQEEQIHYALVLRWAHGWTPQQRERYFRWFYEKGARFSGGNSMQGFLKKIHAEAKDRLPDEERAALARWLVPLSGPAIESSKPRPFVKAWTLAELEPALDALKDRKPDLERGKQLFADAQCARCHLFRDAGGNVGPDLTAVAQRFQRHDILEAITDPNKAVSEQYALTTLTVIKFGGGEEQVTGLLQEETSGTVRILTDPLTGAAREFYHNVVKKKDKAAVSLMPPALLNTLSAEEVADLLAYLGR